MAVYSGKDGSLAFENAGVARVRSWSFQGSVDTLETTNLGQIAREYVPGLKSGSGSCTIYYHDDNATLASVLDNCITSGTPASGRLQLRWGGKVLAFDALINSVGLGCTTGDVMSAEVSFTMSGDYAQVSL